MPVSLLKAPYPRYASKALVKIIAEKNSVEEAEDLAGVAIDGCLEGSFSTNREHTVYAIAEYRAAVRYVRERLSNQSRYIIVEA